jgi:hypothetical protein
MSIGTAVAKITLKGGSLSKARGHNDSPDLFYIQIEYKF